MAVPVTRRPASARIAVVALAAWTAFVWLTRINNALTDEALSSAAKAGSVLLSLSLLGLAAASVWAVWTARATRVISVFVGWTVVVWAVRLPQILLADHTVGFKAVHAVLGLVSMVLAMVVWRVAVSPQREPAGTLA